MRRAPRTEFCVYFACSTPARISHASHATLCPTCTATHHPQHLTPLPHSHFCRCAVGCGVHTPPPSLPHRSTPLRPQVVILDFCDTFSSRSRRRSHHFLLCDLFLLSDLQRAVCVAVGTGVSVTCRSARRAVFCVDSVVCLVILLFHQAHTGLLHTLGCRGQFTRLRQALCVCTRRGKARNTDTPTHDTRPCHTTVSPRLFYS